MNEELHSSSEELETGREELQSINEELTTVNAELKVKVDELSHANSDLSNLMAATEIATIFLDRDLHILRYTPTAVTLFRLIASDLGRPLTDLTHRLHYPQLKEDAERVLSELVPMKREVSDGKCWYLAQLLPYRTFKNHIAGLVLTFVDITETRIAEMRRAEIAAELERQSRLFDITLSSITDFAYTFDREGRFTYANRPLLDLLKRSIEEVVGRNFHELDYPLELATKLQAQIEHVFTTREIVVDETPFRDPSGEEGYYEYIFSPVVAADGSVEVVAGSTRVITERKRAEAALRRSEERLRTLADAVPQIIWTNNAEGMADYFNWRWYEYSGLTPEESLGAGWQAIVHPDDAEIAKRRWLSAQTAGEVFDTEYRLRRADGQYRWFIGRNVPTKDEEGRVTGWFGTATDVQELKEATTALSASEEQFRRAIEDAPIPVIMHAEDGQILQVSKMWTELTGYTLEDIPTFDEWLSRAYGADAGHVGEQVQVLFSGHARMRDAELDVITRRGERRRWSFSASAPGTLHDGRRFMVAMALDITERTVTEEALRESQERLRLIVENAREYAIFSLDLDRCIESWNSGAEAILGYTQEEAIGQSGDMIFTAEDCAECAAAKEAQTAIKEGRAADERWHVRKDGSRFWGSGVMMAMRNAAGEAIGLVKIFRDQTVELHAKEALEKSRAELWEALQETESARAEAEAATQAKDHFLAVLSHELRTPLTPVLMAVRTLARRKDLPAPVFDALEMIQRNVQLEASFIDDMLDVTRISRGKLELVCEPMHLHEAIKRAVEVTEGDLQAKQQQLTVQLEAAEDRLVGDFTRLQQVFWNLLKNASKFTPQGGEIHVSSRGNAERIVVEITDTGIGFDPQAADRIFDPFAQANLEVTREFGGLGLGLAISKATVDGHGGTVCATSPGALKGSTFTVELPLNATPGRATSGR